MSDHGIDVEALARRIHEERIAHDREDCRLIAFYESVGEVPGPVGELVREVAAAYSSFQEAQSAHGTTEGESDRLDGVLQAALQLVEFLRDGGQL